MMFDKIKNLFKRSEPVEEAAVVQAEPTPVETPAPAPEPSVRTQTWQEWNGECWQNVTGKPKQDGRLVVIESGIPTILKGDDVH